MKAKLNPKQAFTLYGVILGFVFAFYLIGLFIGRNYAEDTAVVTIPESAGEPVRDVTPMLDFYQQLETHEPRAEGAETESSESRQSEDPSLVPGTRDAIEKEEGSISLKTTEIADDRPVSQEERIAEVSTSNQESSVRYTIQIGAFSTEKEAKQVLLRLQNKNFPARLQAPMADENPSYYRVWVGGFATIAEASRLEEQLKKESFPTYLKKLD